MKKFFGQKLYFIVVVFVYLTRECFIFFYSGTPLWSSDQLFIVGWVVGVVGGSSMWLPGRSCLLLLFFDIQVA